MNDPHATTNRIIATLLLVIAAGPYFSNWISQRPEQSISAQEFVLVDGSGNQLALWTALDGHPRLEFLGRGGKPALELGMHTPDNAGPLGLNPSEPRLRFNDTTDPEAGPQVAMSLKKSGNRVSHTLYSVRPKSSIPAVHFQSGSANPKEDTGAHATFVGPNKGVSILNWEEDGSLKLLIGGGGSGKGVTIQVSPDGKVLFSSGTLQRIFALFD